MEYRTLGRTGVRVSTYALGTMMFGADGNPDEKQCIDIIHAALDSGINIVDTADTYSHGQAEEIVGKALAGRRHDVVLASKVRLRAGDGPNEQGASRMWIMRQVEASLKRLRTDHIDLYQIHRPDLDTELEETLDVLTDLVRDGKIRYFGCSMFPAWYQAEARSISLRRGLKRFASETSPYSIFVRAIELDVLPAVKEYGMGLLVWSPLNGGWLSGKYRRDAAIPADSRAALVQGPWGEHYPILQTRFDVSRPGNQRKLDMIEKLLTIAKDAGLSLSHMALAFPLVHPAVTAVNFGVRNLQQFNDVKAGFDTRLSDDVLNAIDECNPPGSIVDEADRGWILPWMSREARRRPKEQALAK
jgi:aryl-alcohol dehydrogenase-like predicted oxidoreductase